MKTVRILFIYTLRRHRHEIENKVKAIEIIDKEILGTMLPELNKYDDFKIMILPDHPTPLSLKTHTNDAVPFMIYTKSVNAGGKPAFTEKTAAETGLYIEKGPSIMKYFIDLHN